MLNEGRTFKIDKQSLNDQETLEVSNITPDNLKITDKEEYESFIDLYKGVVDMKCMQEYGTLEDKDLWEDCAKELYLKSKEYLPTLSQKATKELNDLSKKEESNHIASKSKIVESPDVFTNELSNKLQEEEITPANIKEKALQILPKEDVDVKDSDLYIKVSDKSKKLINKLQFKNNGLLTTFRSPIDNEMWYDIPFANLDDYITSKTESNNNTYYYDIHIVEDEDTGMGYSVFIKTTKHYDEDLDADAIVDEAIKQNKLDADEADYCDYVSEISEQEYKDAAPHTEVESKKLESINTSDLQIRKYPNEEEFKGVWGLYDIKQNKFLQKGPKYLMKAALNDFNKKSNKINESFDLDLIEKNIKGKRLSDAARYLGALVNGDRNSFEIQGSELVSKLDSKDKVMCAVEGNDIIKSIVRDFTHLTDKTESLNKTCKNESYYIKLFNKDNTDMDTIEASTEQEAIKTAEEKMKEGWRAVVYNADNKEALYDYDPFENNEVYNESKERDLSKDLYQNEANKRVYSRLQFLDVYLEELADAIKHNNTDSIDVNKSKIQSNIAYLIPALNIKGGVKGLVDYLQNTDFDFENYFKQNAHLILDTEGLHLTESEVLESNLLSKYSNFEPSKRDLEKMKYYYSKNSNPNQVASSIKNLDKCLSRFFIAEVLNWKSCSQALYERAIDLALDEGGFPYEDEVREVLGSLKVQAKSYKMDDVYKVDTLSDDKSISTMRRYFSKTLDVLTKYKIPFQLNKREPTSSELYMDGRNGRCWTIAYDLVMKMPNGKEVAVEIANHTNEGGGSYGVCYFGQDYNQTQLASIIESTIKENLSNEKIEENKLQENNTDLEYKYMLLDRLKQDCEYFLGNGNGNAEHSLWAKDIDKQIEKMKEIYNSFSEEEKPDWITLEDINYYEKRMKEYNKDVKTEDLSDVEESVVSDYTLSEIKKVIDSVGDDFNLKISNADIDVETKTLSIDREDLISIYNTLGGNKDSITESRPDKDRARAAAFAGSRRRLQLPAKGLNEEAEIIEYLEKCKNQIDIMNVNEAIKNTELRNKLLTTGFDFAKSVNIVDDHIDEFKNVMIKATQDYFQTIKTESKEGYQDKCCMCGTSNLNGCYSVLDEEGNVGSVCVDCGKKYSLPEIEKKIDSDMKSESKEVKTEGTNLKRISRYNEFDNGHVLHNDWKKISDEEAEELAKQASIKDPTDVYYVQFDDIINSSNNNRWYKGKLYTVDEINAIRRKEKEDLLKKVQQEKNSKTKQKSLTEDQYEYDRRKGRPNIKKIAETEYYDNQEWYDKNISNYEDMLDFIYKEVADIAYEYNLKEKPAKAVCELVYLMAKKRI